MALQDTPSLAQMATFQAVVDQFTLRGCLAVFLVLAVFSLLLDLRRRPSYPSSIPRVGYGQGVVGSIKNYFLASVRHKDWVAEGYEKYTKNDQAFVVPPGLGRRSAVILPRSQTQWLFDLPDHLVSPDEANNDSLHTRYNFVHPQDPFNNRTINRNLLRSLDGLIPGMQEEVQETVDRTFGVDSHQWKSVNIWDMWLDVIPQITNRMVLGKSLCRESKVIKAMVDFTESVLVNIFLFDFVPAWLHPLLGPFLAIPNYIHYRRGLAITMPVIKERLAMMQSAFHGDEKVPEDFITWAIRQALAEGNASELRPDKITKRMLLVEIASIHTTAMTAQNALLDLVSCDPSILASLREEAERVYEEAGRVWTKASLAKLYRIDSAIRESQRRSNFAVTLLDYKVVAPQGVTNKAMGWTLPYGSTMALNLHGVYHDPQLHDDPEAYDALRYSRPIEALESTTDGETSARVGSEARLQGMVTTGHQHLVFGHGRHACPGRFFVAHELKMAIAYMLLNYEIKQVRKRPEPSIMGNFIMPPFKALMQVRRRLRTDVIHSESLQGQQIQKDIKNKVQLTGAQATMLATLQGRMLDAEHEKPIIGDTWARHMLDRIDYDFSKLKMDRIQSVAICMRTRTMDRWVLEFLSKHQDSSIGATVVCLGVGLDSRALRLDWASNARWVDVDMPDVVDLRRRLLPEPSGDYQLIASSVTEESWLNKIPNDRPTLIVAEGLVMYLTEADGEDLVLRLVQRFAEGQLVLDAVGSLMTRLQSWRRDGMLKATNTVMPWGWKYAAILEDLDASKPLVLRDLVRFREQDGADELPLPVRGLAWGLSRVPILKDIGWTLRYEF